MTSPAPAWHALPLSDVLRRLRSTPNGLTEVDARERRRHCGPNALAPPRAEPALRILLRQFRSIVTWLLVAAVLAAVANADLADAGAVGVVLAINVSLGFAIELRARRAMHALLRLDVPRAIVLRDGTVRECDAHELAPGDVVVLEEGRSVPADARLIEANELRVSEAALTGESLPSDKRADAIVGAGCTLADRANMVFSATVVLAGSGRAVVVSTGMNTEVGRIGSLLDAIPEERTPVERRLDSLGRRLAGAAIVAGLAIGAIAWLRGAGLQNVLQTAVAVAVAAVPEGLPAVVTIAMAVGVHRMARRHALVRRLSVVESLGAATVICTDKTGTLTAGEQTVTSFWLAGRFIRVTGAGYREEGAFFEDGAADGVNTTPDEARTIDPQVDPALRLALETGSLANRGGLDCTGGEPRARGDPTDVALIVAARKAGLDREALVRERPEAGEVPFSSARMLMATFHLMPGGDTRAYVKGAMTRVLERCTAVYVESGTEPMTDAWRGRIRAAAAALGARGLRVLALASGIVDGPSIHSLGGLTFTGLVGMTDPPAPAVNETVRRLQRAGIRLVMITGDQRETAESIGRSLGIVGTGDVVIEGEEIERMSDVALATALPSIAAVSRATPQGKLRLVDAFAKAGEVVAMLGDGINDAAALKRAHVGVAMGRRGTDVAKEASGIILQDDRFETIAAAVEEGRVVFANIRRFVFYLFSCNVAELFALLVAGLAGLPLPMTPMQILWVNIVTDVIVAMPLVFEPPESDVMHAPPRHPAEAILPKRLLREGIAFAFAIAAVTLAALAYGLRGPASPVHAVTLSFMTLTLAQVFHLGNARSSHTLLGLRSAPRNTIAVVAVAFALALQVATVRFALLARVLGTAPMGATDWIVVIALSLLPAAFGRGLRRMSGIGRHENPVHDARKIPDGASSRPVG